MISNSSSPFVSSNLGDPSDLSTHGFSNNKENLEALSTLEYPWDDMHHRSFFIPEGPMSLSDQFSVKTKDFIHGKVDWLKDPIPALDTFE